MDTDVQSAGSIRCPWAGPQPDYVVYHDEEWGMPVVEDHALFEKLCLEGFQSGLSWLTILRKREHFREAFEGFDFERVARFTDADVERLLENPGIVRHRKKIESTINNAKRAIELAEAHGGLAPFFWSFEPPPEERPEDLSWASLKTIGQSAASQRLAKSLKKRGFSFVGPTTAYAFMQAMGLVNDHIEGCICRPTVEAARAGLVRPSLG